MKKILILLSSIILVSITSSSVSSCELNHSTNNLTPLTPATPVPKKIPLTPLTPSQPTTGWSPINPPLPDPSVPSNLIIFDELRHLTTLTLTEGIYRNEICPTKSDPDQNVNDKNLYSFQTDDVISIEAKFDNKYQFIIPWFKIVVGQVFTFRVNDCLVDKTIDRNIYGGSTINMKFLSNGTYAQEMNGYTVQKIDEINFTIYRYPKFAQI